MDSLIDIIRRSIEAHEDKVVFSDETEEETYKDFGEVISAIGTALVLKRAEKVCILLNKGVKALNCMFGCIYAGATYIVLDSASPVERLQKIVDTINPSVLIYEEKTKALCDSLVKTGQTASVDYKAVADANSDLKLLDEKERESKPDDLVYILFTSGSTGTPKGVMITQANLISYMGWFTVCFHITSDTIFGNQTPFYFSMSVSDVFATVFTGATLFVIPQQCFSFPVNLIKYLNDKKINTVYWVPSVFAIIHFYKILDYVVPKYLTTILFAGEVMQMKDLNYFKSKIPGCNYANLFGPTETTDICTYYKVNREFKDSDSLPIGVCCEGLSCYLLDENLKECKFGEEGELYVGGPFVSPGYFNDPIKTAETFVKVKTKKGMTETLYKTGDLCTVNDYGEYMFTGRADFQIKHMGYRIELGEIEEALLAHEKVLYAIAIYNAQDNQIMMVYSGNLNEDEALDVVKAAVPYYMVPNVFIKVPSMKFNANGKIDRAWYKKNYKLLIKQ